MAMTIFFILNGLGVAFLLYVLANFWKERQPAQNDAPAYITELEQQGRTNVIAMSHPISQPTYSGFSVGAFPKDRREFVGTQDGSKGAREAARAPVRLVSAR